MNLRELQCAILLPGHPNVLRMHDIVRDNDDWGYFVFEYMGGGDLLQYFEKRAGIAPPDVEIRCLLQQILRGLDHMHAHGMTHRDVKPENSESRLRIAFLLM